MLDPNMNDRDVLRQLAQGVADVAASSAHRQKTSSWIRLNGLDSVRPMVWMSQIPWHEMNVNNELTLQCGDEAARNLETQLRRTLYQWNHMPCDMVVSGYLECAPVYHKTSCGFTEDTDVVSTDDDNNVVSRHFKRQIIKPEDVEKITAPRVTFDRGATDKQFEWMTGLFADILPVRRVGIKHIWFTPWDNLIRWWGIQDALMDLVLRPEMVSAAVSRFVDASLSELKQYEDLGLLSVGNNNMMFGSGGYGYSDELPPAGEPALGAAPGSMWGCSNAQIFSEVSPEMHWEFALKHEMRWLEKWGLTYYGCCEPLDRKMDLMRKIPNLRKISISPWADIERTVDEVHADYVISYKPNPAILAGDDWSIARAERDLTAVLEKARGCHVEIIFKDISTVRYQPQRLWEWAAMARRVVERI